MRRLQGEFSCWLFRFTEWPKDAPRWATVLVCAEDDYGELWLPSTKRREWWVRRLNLRRPGHWPYFLLSRLTGWVVLIEGS